MITAKLLREWKACWSSDRIASLGKTEMTPREVANSESISLDDRLWVLCKSLWYLDASAARGFAVESALLVAHLAGDEEDQAQYLGLLNLIMEIGDLPESAADERYQQAANATGLAEVWSYNTSYCALRATAFATAFAAASAAASAGAFAAADAAASAAAAEFAEGKYDRDAYLNYFNAYSATKDAWIRKSIDRALEWLGGYADGWEEP